MIRDINVNSENQLVKLLEAKQVLQEVLQEILYHSEVLRTLKPLPYSVSSCLHIALLSVQMNRLMFHKS